MITETVYCHLCGKKYDLSKNFTVKHACCILSIELFVKKFKAKLNSLLGA